MAYYLSMDGVDDKFTPTLTVPFRYISMRVKDIGNKGYLFDLRTTGPAVYFSKSAVSGVTALQVDGVTKTVAYSSVPTNQTVDILFDFGSDKILSSIYTVSARYTGTNSVDFFNGNFYDLKAMNSSMVVLAHYDMTLGNQVAGTIQDQSGNGRHATLTGGTWVDEGGAGTTHTGNVTVQGVSTVTASGTVSTGHIGQASVIGVASVTASGSVLGPAQTGDAAVVGVSSVVATGSVNLRGNVAIVGVSTVIASAAGMPIKGDASVFGVSSVTASGIMKELLRRKIILSAERRLSVTLHAERRTEVLLSAERRTTIQLQAGGTMTKKGQNFDMFAGESLDLIFPMRENISGASITWTLKTHQHGTQLVQKTVGNGITVNGNSFTVRLDSSDTASLQGRYYHDADISVGGRSVKGMTGNNIMIE